MLRFLQNIWRSGDLEAKSKDGRPTLAEMVGDARLKLNEGGHNILHK